MQAARLAPGPKGALHKSESGICSHTCSVRHGRLWEEQAGRDRWQKAQREPTLLSPSPAEVEEKDKSSAPHIHALD